MVVFCFIVILIFLPYAATCVYQFTRDANFAKIADARKFERNALVDNQLLGAGVIEIRTMRGTINNNKITVVDCFLPTFLQPPRQILKYFTPPFSWSGARTKLFINDHEFGASLRVRLFPLLSRKEIEQFLADVSSTQT